MANNQVLGKGIIVDMVLIPEDQEDMLLVQEYQEVMGQIQLASDRVQQAMFREQILTQQ